MNELQDAQRRSVTLASKVHDLYASDSSTLHRILKKAAKKADEGRSEQTTGQGRRTHLIDKRVARELRDFNDHHARALEAKIRSSVGLGHRDTKIDKILNPLCKFSWQDTLDTIAEDFWEGGDGYLEVVYGDEANSKRVTGLYHVPADQVFVEVEQQDDTEHYHYSIDGETFSGTTNVMARFGDREDLGRRYGITSGRPGRPRKDPNRHPSHLRGDVSKSEIIHFRMPTNRSRWYGYPDYMSAVPSIELVQCVTQFQFDFFFNRGVPEYLLLAIGNIPPETWEEIVEVMKAQQGLGNSQRAGAIQIPGLPETIHIQVEKMMADTGMLESIAPTRESLAMAIVTAHGVPPILAGVQIPGKMGANNEGPNALLLFQKQKLGHAQRIFSQTLACTLGDDEIEFNQPDGTPVKIGDGPFLGEGQGPLDEHDMPQHVSPGNGFRTVLDGMTLGAMETMSTMREPMAGSGRNPEDGKLEGTDDRASNDPRRTR